MHHTATGDGVELCAVDHTRFVRPSKEDSIVVERGDWVNFLWELPPGGEGRSSMILPEHYCHAMQAGETYTLLYPGGEMVMWDWGTRLEHLDKELKARHRLEDDEMRPALMVSGGASISLVACEEETPWPDRAATQSMFGVDMANTMEKRWREKEALKGMRVVEGRPLSLGPEDRVQVCLVQFFKTILKLTRFTARERPSSTLRSSARQPSLPRAFSMSK